MNPPEFTLKASDNIAPALIKLWIVWAKYRGVNKDRINSAEKVLLAVVDWQKENIKAII